MAGMHATMWIACRIPDWLYFGDFDLVLKQIEMAGVRSKCFGNFDARIEMDRNRSN
jgi:flavin reductase (DIM6/NTAB) family NADH-FMN oxidoreductase RutF